MPRLSEKLSLRSLTSSEFATQNFANFGSSDAARGKIFALTVTLELLEVLSLPEKLAIRASKQVTRASAYVVRSDSG